MSSIASVPVIKTATVQGRRNLRFESLDEVLTDAQYAASVSGRTLGNWTVAQIIDHLGKSIQAGFDGPAVKAPWFVRWLIAPLIRGRFLSQGMPAGFTLPKRMTHFMPDEDVTVGPALDKFQVWLERLKQESPVIGHPAFGKLSHADWIRLHLRHAELHLSFIIPQQD